MKLAIIGAKGLVGTPAVAEAISRGHEVDGFTRSGQVAEGATSHTVQLGDTAAVAEIIKNHDFTIIATGGRDNYESVIQAHRDLIAAQPQGRFLVVGGAGALNAGEGRLYDTPEFPEEYKTEAKSFGQVFDAYADGAAGLQWSMLAPAPEIAPGVRTGDYKSELDVPAGGFVSAEDFALALIDEAEEGKHIGQRFTVASANEAAARG